MALTEKTPAAGEDQVDDVGQLYRIAGELSRNCADLERRIVALERGLVRRLLDRLRSAARAFNHTEEPNG